MTDRSTTARILTVRRGLALVALLAVTSVTSVVRADAASTATATTAAFTFVPPVVTIAEGDSLVLDNIDIAPHNLTAGDGTSFASADVPPNASGEVHGVPELDAGQYPFFCTLHPWMQGMLDVGTAPGVPLPSVPAPGFSALPVGGIVVTPTSLTTYDGSMYVASYATGVVSELPILSGGVLGAPTPYATGFTNPLGIAFGPDGTLFVADSHSSTTPGRTTDGRVWAVEPGGASMAIAVDGLPNGRHNTNGMAVHEGRLYIANGNATDNGNPDSPGGPAEVPDRSGALLSIPLDGRNLTSADVQVEATGMRNIYDVEFRPGTDEAWLPMNGPDAFDPYGEDLLLKADTAAAPADFGFPACLYGPRGVSDWIQNSAVAAQCTGAQKLPEQLLGLHVSADGLAFDVDAAFLYIAEFGNFFGNEVVGHKVVRVPVDADGASGPPQDVLVGGAPLDVTTTADGIYVADFATGQIILLKPLA
ncbi:MAG: cupredoxin domain-containing protein [Microthrixaceae bacterium]